jgi:hypothetical protein
MMVTNSPDFISPPKFYRMGLLSVLFWSDTLSHLRCSLEEEFCYYFLIDIYTYNQNYKTNLTIILTS